MEVGEEVSSSEKGQVSSRTEAAYVQIAGLYYLTGVHYPVFKQGAHDAVQ